MMTLCIILLLGGFAIHGLVDQKRKHEMDGLQESFINLLYSARNAAIIHHSEVIVCPMRNKRRALLERPSCGKRNQWQLGKHRRTIAKLRGRHRSLALFSQPLLSAIHR